MTIKSKWSKANRHRWRTKTGKDVGIWNFIKLSDSHKWRNVLETIYPTFGIKVEYQLNPWIVRCCFANCLMFPWLFWLMQSDYANMQMLLVAGFSLLVAVESLLSSREDDTRSWGNHLFVAGFSLLVAVESLLSSREDDTRSWGNFLVYFSHKLIQCHANLRGWSYILIGC
jgi:hypothetical protein